MTGRCCRAGCALALTLLCVVLLSGAQVAATTEPISYSDGVRAAGPAGYWRLGESTGASAGDASGNLGHGQWYGTTAIAAPGALADDSDTGASLDGNDDHVRIPDSNALDLTSRMTVEAWVKKSSLAARQAILYKDNIGADPTGSYGFRVEPGGQLVLERNNVDSATSARGITSGAWRHVVASFDSAANPRVRFYIDGEPAGTSNGIAAPFTANTQTLLIGRAGPPPYPIPWQGALDEVALYPTALTESKVRANYERGRGAAVPPPPESAYTNRVLSDSPRALWRLGESAGTAVGDSSENHNDAQRKGGTASAQAGAIVGDSDNAAGFDGIDDYIEVPASTALDLTSQLSFEAWVKKSSLTARQAILYKENIGADPTGSYGLRVEPGGRLLLERNNQDGVSSTRSITGGAWHHVAVTFDAAASPRVRFYIDGEPAGESNGIAGAFVANSQTLLVGRTGPPAYAIPWQGALDEVAVYDRALAPAVVRAHHARGRDTTEPTVTLSGAAYDQREAGLREGSQGLHVDARDGAAGTGVEAVEIRIDGATAANWSGACAGGGCAMERDFELDAAAYGEGTHTLTVVATDTAGNAHQEVMLFRVDRTAPTIAVAGSMWTDREQALTERAYGVTVDGADAQGTGVARVGLRVDGATVDSAEQTCAAAGCAMTRAFEYQNSGAVEARRVAVTARDRAGNEATRSWVIGSQPATCDTAGGAQAADAGATASVVAAAEDAHPPAVAPSVPTTEDGQQVEPSVARTGDDLVATGTLTPATISSDPSDGFAFESGDDTNVCVTPVDVDASAKEADVVNGDAVAFADTAEDSDTVVRPTATGVETFTTIRSEDAPTEYRWKVDLEGGEVLQETESGGVAIVDPTPERTAADAGPRPADTPADPDELDEAIADGRVDDDAVAPDPNAVADARAAADAAGVTVPSGLEPAENAPETPSAPQPCGASACEPPADPPASTPIAELPSALAAEAEAAGAAARTDAHAELDGMAADAVATNADEEAAVDAEATQASADAEVVAEVEPVWAKAADGEAVPTELSVEGNTITMTVDHTSGEHAYPIVADPLISEVVEYDEWRCCLPTYEWRYVHTGQWWSRWDYIGSWVTAWLIDGNAHRAVGSGWYHVYNGDGRTYRMQRSWWGPIYVLVQGPIYEWRHVHVGWHSYVHHVKTTRNRWVSDTSYRYGGGNYAVDTLNEARAFIAALNGMSTSAARGLVNDLPAAEARYVRNLVGDSLQTGASEPGQFLGPITREKVQFGALHQWVDCRFTHDGTKILASFFGFDLPDSGSFYIDHKFCWDWPKYTTKYAGQTRTDTRLKKAYEVLGAEVHYGDTTSAPVEIDGYKKAGVKMRVDVDLKICLPVNVGCKTTWRAKHYTWGWFDGTATARVYKR